MVELNKKKILDYNCNIFEKVINFLVYGFIIDNNKKLIDLMKFIKISSVDEWWCVLWICVLYK